MAKSASKKILNANDVRTIYYLGNRPDDNFGTVNLTMLNSAVLDRRGIDYEIIPGEILENDRTYSTPAHLNSYYSLTQLSRLIILMNNGQITSNDVIYFGNMMHPGIESLPYILSSLTPDMRPKIFIRGTETTLHADSFMHTERMIWWSREYERMVTSFVDGIIFSNEELIGLSKISGWNVPVYNVSGHEFNKDEVIRRVMDAGYEIKTLQERKMRVAFCDKWGASGNPEFFMDFVEEWIRQFGMNVEFSVLSRDKIRYTDTDLMIRTRHLIDEGKLKMHECLDSTSYYLLLNDSRILFNCNGRSLEDVSISEADSLGCNILYPSTAWVPEISGNDHDRMYVPWSITDAINKTHWLLMNHHGNIGKISDWTTLTIDRIIDIMSGKGEEWLRSSPDYRKHVREAKYT